MGVLTGIGRVASHVSGTVPGGAPRRMRAMDLRSGREKDSVREIRALQGPFRLSARVPDDVVDIPADEGWAAWAGFSAVRAGGRRGMLLVSVAVTAFSPPSTGAPSATLADVVRERYPEAALVGEFSTADGLPAVSLRMAATVDVRGNPIGTGQAQALVVYPEAGALGVVSGVCFHADDLDATAVLVARIAERMSVEVVAAAA